MRCASLPRLFLASICLLGLTGISLATASAEVADRITAPVTSASFVPIPNSVNPRVKSATDLGPAAANMKLNMSIRFSMTSAQQAALDQLLADQQNPSSPRYHQWLTPAQYAAQFGLSSADLATVSSWLTSQGFTVTAVANGGTFIVFSGTVAQAQTAFATSIHSLSVDGETHYANVTDISVPSAFGGVVQAVTGLHNFRLKPRVKASVVKPNFTYPASASGQHYIAPGDIWTIYNVNPLLNAGFNGTNETIAVTGQVDIYPADIAAFRSASGLSTTNLPSTVHAYGYDPGPPQCNSCTNEPSEDDLNEASIDVEWSGAMAPSASILFVNGDGALPNAISYAIDNNSAPIVTTSYGLCEAGWGFTEMTAMNALFQQANAQGQTVLAAAADQGATDCDAGPTAIEGLAVDFPGSSPFVTDMGGTQFNDGTATGATQYWSTTNAAVGSGSAISYIPESPWNNEPLFQSYGGGGGGVSNFFAKPAWQTGNGVPADGLRDVPDLALDASDGQDPLFFCDNVAAAEGAQACTNGYLAANGDADLAGGTSFDSQIFGGLLADIEQKLGSRVGNANPVIYALANSTYYAAGQNTLTNSAVVFNDVTTGNNDMPCAVGTPNCTNGGQIGFSAGSGYDLASGWGSVNVTNLANDWALVKPLSVGSLGPNVSATSLTTNPACATAVSGGPCSATAASGSTVTLTATVAGYIVTATNPLTGTVTETAGATPTGTVKFLANNVVVGSGTLNGSGVATYSWVTSCSYLGQQVLTAAYSGDSNYQGSVGPLLTANGSNQTADGSNQTSPVELQVTSASCPNFTISAGQSTVTVAKGGTIPAVTITVTPTNGFTGTVTFSTTGSYTSDATYAPTFNFSPASVTISSSAAVTTSLTLSGITAGLHLPGTPGQVDSGPIMANRKDPAPAYHGLHWYQAGSGLTVASLLLLVLPRKRRLGGLLLVVLAVALIGGATGCGSSQAGPPSTGTGTGTSSNPDVGTYTVNVIGAYTNSSGETTQQVTTITYTIN